MDDTTRTPDRRDTSPGGAVKLYIRVSRLHHSAVEGRVSRMGIHHSQHRMLMHLSRYEHIPSQRELADALGISPAAVTTTLQRLEKAGLITRCMTDEDNRRNEIRITEEGRRRVSESRAIFDTVDCATFAGFTEEELESFTAMLERMHQNLRAELDRSLPPAPSETD